MLLEKVSGSQAHVLTLFDFIDDQVLAIYHPTSGRHASRKHLSYIGEASYISFAVYARISATKLTSCSCPELNTTTFLHLPPPEILFIFSGFKITRTEEAEEDGSVTTILTLPPDAAKIYKQATSHARQLRDISILLRKKKKHREGPETDSESEGGECGSGEDDGEEDEGTESEVVS